MEKMASPELVNEVYGAMGRRRARQADFAAESRWLFDADGRKIIDRQTQKARLKYKPSFKDRVNDWNDKLNALDERINSRYKQSIVEKKEGVQPSNDVSLGETFAGRREQKNIERQDKIHQKNQIKQQNDNLRIEKEYKLQQALKNPSFRPDTIDPKAQDQSLWAAVRGNKPQGGDRNQAITPKTSVFANPNNQSSLGARMLSWGKNNPGKAAIGAGLTTAGVAAAAYGVHRAKQLKKRRQEQQNQQLQDGMYRAASEELNVLYIEKLASADVEDITSQIADEVQDDASLIEKLQESAKYTKKEDVPGGKSSPSRLVQRKNKERFMK